MQCNQVCSFARYTCYLHYNLILYIIDLRINFIGDPFDCLDQCFPSMILQNKISIALIFMHSLV